MNTFDILDRPIAFHRVFVTLTGSVTAALMLSQAIYWTRRTSSQDGWFWKTQEDWERETGLTRHEQEAARSRLSKTTFWMEERRGAPAKLYYHVDEASLENELRGHRRELTLDEVIDMDSVKLNGLSRIGYMRAKRAGVEYEFVSYVDVLNENGMRCSICGNPITKGIGQKQDELCFDHVIPIAAGGAHTKKNIKPAHFQCNARKGKITEDGDNSQNAYTKHSRMSTVDNQECLPNAISLYGTESTSKTTSMITSKTTSNHHHQTSSSSDIPNDDDDGLKSESSVLISPHLKLAETITEHLPSWTGSKTFLRGLNEAQQIAAASWLYLWYICNSGDDWEAQQNAIVARSQYKHFPFDGVDNVIGKIITQARSGNIAPLSAEHKESFAVEIKAIFDDLAQPV